MVICAELFAAKMKAEGIRFNVIDRDDGGCVLSVPFEDRTTNVFFDGDNNGTHPALRTVFEHCPAEKIADVLVVCNELNVKYRWVKFCIDNDCDIMVEDDAIVSPESAGEELLELVFRTASIIKDVKPTIMRAIYS